MVALVTAVPTREKFEEKVQKVHFTVYWVLGVDLLVRREGARPSQLQQCMKIKFESAAKIALSAIIFNIMTVVMCFLAVVSHHFNNYLFNVNLYNNI